MIYLDLGTTHLVVNGTAYPYYVPTIKESRVTTVRGASRTAARGFSNSRTNVKVSGGAGSVIGSANQNMQSSSYGASVTTTVSNTKIPSRIVAIPPRSRKVIGGVKMVKSRYQNCDLKAFPTTDVSAVNFTPQNTPIEYRVVVYYGFDEGVASINRLIESSFYVKSVANYPSRKFISRYHPDECGKKERYTLRYTPYYSNTGFFVKYSR